MIGDLAARAENGDAGAPGEIVESFLRIAASGTVPEQTDVLIAEQWARYAAEGGMVWPRLRLVDVLAVIAGWHLHHGATREAIYYAAEALAVADHLINTEFDRAEPLLMSLGQRIVEAGLGMEPFVLAKHFEVH